MVCALADRTVIFRLGRSLHRLDCGLTRQFRETTLKIRTFGSIATFCLLAASYTLAAASPISYAFTSTANSGPLRGSAATGTFTFDSSSVVTGGSNSATALLTGLNFTWDGITYNSSTANTGRLSFDSAGNISSFGTLFGTQCSAGTCGVGNNEDWYVQIGGGISGSAGFVYSVAGAAPGFGVGNGTTSLSGPIILPSGLSPGGSFQFTFQTDLCTATQSITDSSYCALDPLAATGYDFATGAGDPNFYSVKLPYIGDNSFSLSFEQSGQLFTTTLAAGTPFVFPTGGVSSFRVGGIEASANLDPSNALAFVTFVSFVSGDGSFTGTMTPLTGPIGTAPEPATFGLIALGLAGLPFIRRRRRTNGNRTQQLGSRNAT